MFRFPSENCIQTGLDGGIWLFKFGGIPFRAIASNGGGWEHVSVSSKKRTPRWNEMEKIKNIFWGPEDIVIQFHPPQSMYINVHPRCLHLWRNKNQEIELPPIIMV